MSRSFEKRNKLSTLSVRAASTLAAAATYQGASEDVSEWGRVGVAIKSDNATDGTLTIEVSHDETNWSAVPREIANTSIETPVMWNIVEKYFRILYTNGTTEATNLSIQCQLSVNADIILAHPLGEILPHETQAQVVRPATDFKLDSARKHIMGQRAFFVLGHNGDMTANTWEDIWPGTGDYNWLQAAIKVEVLSSHAADTSAGLGVRSVELHGLSATGEDQEEIIVMNGTSAVESALTYIRVNAMHNETVGTYGGSHQGDVTVQGTGGGVVLGVMKGSEGAVDSSVQYGDGEIQNSMLSIPLGKVAYITDIEVIPDVAGTKTMDIKLFEREDILDVTTPFAPRRVIWEAIKFQNDIEKPFNSHIKIKALADIWFRGRATASSSQCDIWIDYYLVDANSAGA